MEETVKKAMPSLIVVAIVSLVTAIWRFESVASEVQDLKSDMEDHYTKKEEFVVVKTDLKYIQQQQKELKENQDKMDAKVDIILQAVKK